MGFAAIALLSFMIISNENLVLASHGNQSHHEQMEHHKQQAMQHDENCRTGQSCDHAQAAMHHSETAMNCHEIGDHGCASMHHSEAARHHNENGDRKNYLKHHAFSLHHKGIMNHGDSFVLPPRHQMHIVDSINDIQCKSTHQLIFKSNTGQPLCVKHSTASHFTEKGWASKMMNPMMKESKMMQNNQSFDEKGEIKLNSQNTPVSIALGSVSPGCETTNECYIPYSVSIMEHSSVTWTNDDMAVHTATSGTPEDGPDGIFDSGLIPPGDTYTNQFNEEGMFDYYCIAHSWMTGKVEVLDN